MRGVVGVLLCGVVVAGCSSSPPMRYYTLSESVPLVTSTANAQGAPAASAADAQREPSAPGDARSASQPNASAANAQIAPGTRNDAASASASPESEAPSSRAGIKVGRVTLPGEIDRAQLVYRVDANRLRITEMDRWAAPVDEMIRRVLTANLIARLPAGAGSDPASVLMLDIQEFFGDANCAITLKASWTLTGPQPRISPGVDVVNVPSAGTCPDALPVGMSSALGELSQHIATALQTPPSN